MGLVACPNAALPPSCEEKHPPGRPSSVRVAQCTYPARELCPKAADTKGVQM